MSEALSLALADLKRDAVTETVRRRLEAGDDALAILEQCRRGMALVGERFQSGDYFLADLLISAEIFKEAAAVLEPQLSGMPGSEPLGAVVLATMRGDIHDLGKSIVATLLRAQGFEVHDLGVDVEPAVLVKRVVELRPDFVGFSSLITVAFDSMKEAAEGLARAGVREKLKLLIGGGVTTPELREYLGADFQTMDAVEGVAYCLGVAARGCTWRRSP